MNFYILFFYVFFNKTKITKILIGKSDSIFCHLKIFYFLFFFLFFVLKNVLLLLWGGEWWRESQSRGAKGKGFFLLLSNNSFFVFFVCVKKRKKELILMRREIASKIIHRERKEELWCGLLRTLSLSYVIRFFFFVSSQCFFFCFGPFSPFFSLFFFGFWSLFLLFVCLLFVYLLFTTLNPCLSHLFSSCLFFLSWVSWWMKLEMWFSSSFCLFYLFYLFFFLCSFVCSFLCCLFVSSLLFFFPLFPLPFYFPFSKPFYVMNLYLVLLSLIHFEVFLTALSCQISPVDSPLFCFSPISFLIFFSKICFLTLIVLSYLECFPLLCFSLSFVFHWCSLCSFNNNFACCVLIHFCFLPHLIFFLYFFSLNIFSFVQNYSFFLLLLFLLFDINHTFYFFDLIFGLTFVYCFVVFLWRSHQSWHFPFPLPSKSSLPLLFLFFFIDISPSLF